MPFVTHLQISRSVLRSSGEREQKMPVGKEAMFLEDNEEQHICSPEQKKK